MIKMKKNHHYRYYLPHVQSPTSFNLQNHLIALGWTASRFAWLAHFGEKNLEFHIDAAEALEYKHLLARLVARFCPEVMPETYPINDTNWTSVLNHVAEQYYFKEDRLMDQMDDLVWILKPALLNNGQQIKIFQQLSQIEQHYLSSNRLGGDHVLQTYITNPHLLNGKKYSIRMFVVLTNYAGVFLYPHGYFNVGLHPYQPGQFNDLRSHLTNEHLSDVESNVMQVPTQELDTVFPPIYQQIKTIITAVVSGLQRCYPDAFTCTWTSKRKLAFFGFDFMVDTDMHVWLLEANHGPCFPTSDTHPLQNKLYSIFWQDSINNFVLPIAKRESGKSIKYHVFEKCLISSNE
jgi:hypothetical protein